MRVDIGDGVRLFVDIDGLGLVPDGPVMVERPTVVLVHGGPGVDHSIMKAMSSLADLAQVVYYDQRGHGRSDHRSPDEWNLDVWADDIRRLCDVLGIERPIVVGASFGGMVVQRYLARHPAHPAKAALLATGLRLDVDACVAAFEARGGAEVAAIARRFWNGESEAMPEYMQHCLPLYGGGPPQPDVVARAIMDNDVLAHFQVNEQRTMDLREGLGAVQCPVLVVGGELDPVIPPILVDELVEALPAELVRFELLPGASHMDVSSEQGAAILRDFVSEPRGT